MSSPYFFGAGAAAGAGAGVPPPAGACTLRSAEWPLKVRVSANSPSLWPTMFSDTYTGMCCLPLWTAMVRPTKSGRMVERRDQVLIGRLSFAAEAASTFFMRCPSTNGPFLIERAMWGPYAFLWRLRTIIDCVRLLLRVFLPLAGCPHGDTGWRLPRVRPPSGWSTGFMVSPRTVGRMPRQRFAPALPIWRRLCSSLPTSPIVARQFTCTRRISPERMRSCAYSPSRARSCTPAPAARAICAPLPGIISTQCTVVPTGMLRSGSALPDLIGASEPLRSEEHTSELQSLTNLVCRLLLEKKKKKQLTDAHYESVIAFITYSISVLT